MLRTIFSCLPKTIQLSTQVFKNDFSVQRVLGQKPALVFKSSYIIPTKIFQIKDAPLLSPSYLPKSFLQPQITSQSQVRTVIKVSWKKGKRKSVKTVIRRFYRLNCGNWIRTIAGRFKRRWKKSVKNRNLSLRHVFCNNTQSRMLDKMVTRYWRKPKFYIKNPYEPYEWRENFYLSRRKPWRPEGCDYE